MDLLKLSFQFEKLSKSSFSIKKSDIHGKGVFAEKEFGLNDIIEPGLIMKKETKEKNIYDRTLFASFVNHADYADSNMNLLKVGNDYYFYALKYIAEGEELTIDYKQYEKIVKRESDMTEKDITIN